MGNESNFAAGSRPPLWFLLLSHHSYNKLSHTIQVWIGERRICLCTRCTGIGLGMLAALFYGNILASTVAGTPALIILFTMPAIIDWLFQVFGVRESTSIRRLTTGALVGQAYFVLLVVIADGWWSLFSYYMIVFAGYSIFLYSLFRKTRVMDNYMARSWPLN